MVLPNLDHEFGVYYAEYTSRLSEVAALLFPDMASPGPPTTRANLDQAEYRVRILLTFAGETCYEPLSLAQG